MFVQVSKCSRLSLLSLRYNNLSSLPPEMGNMQNLRILDVIGNKYLCTLVSMIDYLLRTSTEEGSENFKFRISNAFCLVDSQRYYKTDMSIEVCAK